MDMNSTNFNNTLIQVIEFINTTLNETVSVNDSDVPVKDLYEEYRLESKDKLLVYRSIAYVLAVLIIVSNLSVVVSSGLILRKGQKPKSTYLLLGNVSLADTIVGFGIIHGVSSEYTLSSNAMCIIKMGMLVCPAMVSIFSVGFIAIDRYIYIVHGLYYQRWFNTRRVRIGIVLIWIISMILGFMPVTGWVNHELNMTRCYYFALFPGTLVLINSIISLIPISIVAVLYTIILIKALKTVDNINDTIKVKTVTQSDNEPKLRIHRRTVNAKSPNVQRESKESTLKRSASFNFGTGYKPEFQFKSKSIEDLTSDITQSRHNQANFASNDVKQSKIQFESDFSVCTVQTSASIRSLSINNTNNNQPNPIYISTSNTVKSRKIREPNKWRAIKVVMLTSGSIIFTWLPFFITVIFFVFCENKLTNPRCIHLRASLGGPLAILAFLNSTLNPLIYAWWHKGFKKSVMSYYRQCLQKIICHVVR